MYKGLEKGDVHLVAHTHTHKREGGESFLLEKLQDGLFVLVGEEVILTL